MSLLAVVETCNFTYVLLISLILASELGRVDSSGQSDRIFEFLGVLLIFILLLFLVFFSLIERLKLLGRSGGLKSLGVIPAIYCLLRLDLVGGDMGWSILLEIIQISFPHVKTWS